MYVYRLYYTEGYYKVFEVQLCSVDEKGKLKILGEIATFPSDEYEAADRYGASVIMEIKNSADPYYFIKNKKKIKKGKGKNERN